MYKYTHRIRLYSNSFGSIHDFIHTHPNSHPYFITAMKHGYRCFIS